MTEAVKRPRKLWTRLAVEQAFRDFAAVHGRAPKNDELGRHGLPWSRTIERLYPTQVTDGELFGSFRLAVIASGLEDRPVGRPGSVRCGIRVVA